MTGSLPKHDKPKLDEGIWSVTPRNNLVSLSVDLTDSSIKMSQYADDTLYLYCLTYNPSIVTGDKV